MTYQETGISLEAYANGARLVGYDTRRATRPDSIGKQLKDEATHQRNPDYSRGEFNPNVMADFMPIIEHRQIQGYAQSNRQEMPRLSSQSRRVR